MQVKATGSRNNRNSWKSKLYIKVQYQKYNYISSYSKKPCFHPKETQKKEDFVFNLHNLTTHSHEHTWASCQKTLSSEDIKVDVEKVYTL